MQVCSKMIRNPQSLGVQVCGFFCVWGYGIISEEKAFAMHPGIGR